MHRIPLSLRTKFVLGFVTVLVGLTCATLLIVQRFAVAQAQLAVEESARNALLTFQLLQQENQIELSRKADLLAMLVSMRNGEANSIDEVSQDPWLADTCTLVALADQAGRITASRPRADQLQTLNVKDLLERSRNSGSRTVWWLNGGHLYHVALEPYYSDPPLNKALLGTVLVGREMDGRRAAELAKISSGQVLFRRGGEVVVSTLNPVEASALAHTVEHTAEPREIQSGQDTFYARSIEITDGSPTPVSLTVLQSYSGAIASLKQLNRVLLGVGVTAMLVGIVLAFVIADRFTKPLKDLAHGVRALQRGDYDYPLEANGNDEVTRVTRTFDEMRRTMRANEVQRQQLEDQLRQSHKMEALGRLAGGVAHDFNNLLTVIKGHGDLMQDRLEPANPLHSSSKQIIKAAERAAGLTRQLLAFCRMQMLEPKVVDLNALVSEMCKLLRRLVREDIAFAFQAGQSLGRVKADPGQLEQVIINLTVNACDAMPEGGKLSIETKNINVDEAFAAQRAPLGPGEYVLITVTDNGHGMDAETKSRIFEPFFTTKEQGRGTGLGLATVYGVVKQSGGFIWVESEPGEGARFEVFLPRVDEREGENSEPELSSERERRKGTVLLAEDEEEVRELASKFLSSAGYEVFAARDGVEALSIAENLSKPIHVLLSDVVMPRMRGPELARRLKESRNKLQVIYTSGYLDYNKGDSEFLEDGFFLQKPFSRDSLVRKVDEVMAMLNSRKAPNRNVAARSPREQLVV